MTFITAGLISWAGAEPAERTLTLPSLRRWVSVRRHLRAACVVDTYAQNLGLFLEQLSLRLRLRPQSLPREPVNEDRNEVRHWNRLKQLVGV